MRIKFLTFLEGVLMALICSLEALRCRVAVCPDCGRNRYDPEGDCINFEDDSERLN